jgi:hypothetical protein
MARVVGEEEPQLRVLASLWQSYPGLALKSVPWRALSLPLPRADVLVSACFCLPLRHGLEQAKDLFL